MVVVITTAAVVIIIIITIAALMFYLFIIFMIPHSMWMRNFIAVLNTIVMTLFLFYMLIKFPLRLLRLPVKGVQS